MESEKKDEPVIYHKEFIVPLDPAHEEKPTLVRPVSYSDTHP